MLKSKAENISQKWKDHEKSTNTESDLFITALDVEIKDSILFVKLIIEIQSIPTETEYIQFINDIIVHLTGNKIKIFESVFRAVDDKLNVTEFIYYMMKFLPSTIKNIKIDLQSYSESTCFYFLIQLFQDININGEDRLLWTDFTSFLVDHGKTQINE